MIPEFVYRIRIREDVFHLVLFEILNAPVFFPTVVETNLNEAGGIVAANTPDCVQNLAAIIPRGKVLEYGSA